MTLFYMWLDVKSKDKMKQLQKENKNMEHELQQLYLIKDKLYEENKKLKQWDNNKDSRNSRQRVENAKLIKENKILKEALYTIWNKEIDIDYDKLQKAINDIKNIQKEADKQLKNNLHKMIFGSDDNE